MRLAVKFAAIFATAALSFGLLTSATGKTEAAPPSGSVTTPVTAAVTGGSLADGQLTITQFVNQGGQIIANGVLTGTLTDTSTGISQTVSQAVSIPVASIAGTCDVLDLVLGPLHLNLLGLVVDLNQVHLQITAQQAPGNLLGNLLCSVSHLLDSQASPTALTQLLNHILSLLG